MTTKGKGKTFAWLSEHIGHSNADDCLSWPFGCDPEGYGILGHNGRVHKASRLMCELAHGAPPTPKHQAAHSCGRGRFGCVNPSHLSWKTNSENQYDRALHGTKNTEGRRGKVTPDQAQEIRDLAGRMKQSDIAARYGISRSRVSGIINQKKPTQRPRGVYQSGKKWYARIVWQRQYYNLGKYPTEAQAHAAFTTALEQTRNGIAPAPLT